MTNTFQLKVFVIRPPYDQLGITPGYLSVARGIIASYRNKGGKNVQHSHFPTLNKLDNRLARYSQGRQTRPYLQF